MHHRTAGRSRRVRAVAFVSATLSLLVGVLFFAEHDASARTLRGRGGGLFAGLLGNRPAALPAPPALPALPASPRLPGLPGLPAPPGLPALPTLPTVSIFTAIDRLLQPPVAPDAGEAQALAAGRRIAADGTSRARAVVAQQGLPIVQGLVQSIVCPLLLQVRAQVVSQFAALIALVPSLSAPLTVIRNGALAVIDGLLPAFGCPVPSG